MALNEEQIAEIFAKIRADVDTNLQEFYTVLKTLSAHDNHDTWLLQLQDVYAETGVSCMRAVKEKQHELIDKIELLLAKSQRMCKTLRIPMPQFESTGGGLYDDEAFLLNQIRIWQKEIDERKAIVKVVKTSRNAICAKLGRELFEIPEDPLPTDDELQQYRQRIADYEAEHEHRKHDVHLYQEKIMRMAHDLKLNSSVEFEKDIINGNYENSMVDDEHIKNVEVFYTDILEKYTSMQEEIAQLYQRLESLWSLLEVDEVHINNFKTSHSGANMSMLMKLRNEIQHWESVRNAKIETLVIKLRSELQTLWDGAGYTNEQRDSFATHFNSDCFTEELLLAHQAEIERLRQWMNANRKLYELLAQREELLAKVHELNLRETAPDRYKNRGGRLLQEEKERRMVARRIPIIENQLLQLACEHENAHGVEFTYRGESVTALIGKDRELFEQFEKLLVKRNALLPLSQTRTPIRSPTQCAVKQRGGVGGGSKTVPAKCGVSVRRSVLKAKTDRKRRLSILRQKQKNDAKAASKQLLF